ncbi:hypothetical protein D3C85_1418870 [compost metagenome]
MLRALARRARMPVMAKRCASSRIWATSISAALPCPSSSDGRPSAKTSVSSPTLRPSPFATPTSRPISSPSSSNTCRATSTCPLPPSINTTRGMRGTPSGAPSPPNSPPSSWICSTSFWYRRVSTWRMAA